MTHDPMSLRSLESETLAGRFYLEERIGRGGCGIVFRATQLSINRTCAVKIISPELTRNKKTIKRFEIEAKTTSKLTHPNSVTLFDFGFDEQRSVVFIAMEYLDGRDLKQVCAEEDIDLSLAAHLVEQAASSLAEAHKLGLVHRDIKPSNMIIVEQPEQPYFLKIIDFGIAKVLRPDRESIQQLTKSGALLGTPQCMAPEQIRNTEMDGRTDQYALATTVYKMIADRPPFVGNSVMEIASRQLNKPVPSLSEFVDRRRIPRAVDSVLKKALAKRPAERFDSILDFSNALTDSIEAASTEQAPPLQNVSQSLDTDKSLISRGIVGTLLIVTLSLTIAFAVNWDKSQNPDAVEQSPRLEPEPTVELEPLPLHVEDFTIENPRNDNTTQKTPDTPRKASPSPTSSDDPKTEPVKLDVHVIPWGTLFVDGKKVGSSSRQTITIPPGETEFTIKQNGQTKKTRQIDVDKQTSEVEFVLN
jgi:serine/threonine-protein kinase